MKTAIAIVLDRSGSMSSCRDDTIGGFNTFLQEQKDVGGTCLFTLVQFDDKYQVDYDLVPIERVEPLTITTYVPRGSTALLDAIGRTINEVGTKFANMPDNERPNKVLFVIQTDGAENASKEFTRQQVVDMIAHQRDKYSWEFIFLGADMDAIAAGGNLGISNGMSLSYSKGLSKEMFDVVSKTAANYRSASEGTRCCSFTEDDRNKVK